MWVAAKETEKSNSFCSKCLFRSLLYLSSLFEQRLLSHSWVTCSRLKSGAVAKYQPWRNGVSSIKSFTVILN